MSEDERLGCRITETKCKVFRFHETILSFGEPGSLGAGYIAFIKDFTHRPWEDGPPDVYPTVYVWEFLSNCEGELAEVWPIFPGAHVGKIIELILLWYQDFIYIYVYVFIDIYIYHIAFCIFLEIGHNMSWVIAIVESPKTQPQNKQRTFVLFQLLMTQHSVTKLEARLHRSLHQDEMEIMSPQVE